MGKRTGQVRHGRIKAQQIALAVTAIAGAMVGIIGMMTSNGSLKGSAAATLMSIAVAVTILGGVAIGLTFWRTRE